MAGTEEGTAGTSSPPATQPANAAVKEAAHDLEEWKRLRSLASRPNVLVAIDAQIALLEAPDAKPEKDVGEKRAVPLKSGTPPFSATESHGVSSLSQPVKLANAHTSQVHFIPLTSFAWDQTDRAVKVYVKLQGVQDIPKDQVSAKFTTQTMDLEVRDLHSKNYSLSFKRLNQPIAPEGSTFRVKKDMVVVTLQKANALWWADLSFKERKFAAPPKIDENADPSVSIMSLMKNLYEEGDDEMKRTIAKSWMESQQQKATGNSPFGDMPF
ncbi:SGS domain-containing protein [Besnoitia besnoiti]|uniref:SGS domain-containing protein n=1 Tax=Besnoitia besnoiti TaxID=94643 RepID=A0A2A9M9X0_BESBE|nr:SGS domain-containing protein [Besnoitia besnoiti]PFH32473.1 SGS domain-containing protein [Besnoitia besnoiti]